MGFIGRLLGSPRALKSTVKVVSETFDELLYTKEEQAKDKNKSVFEARSMVIEWMRTTQGQNLSRRIIALTITAVWLIMFISRVVMAIIGVWTNSSQWEMSATIIGTSIEQMTGAVMLIVGFYFAAPHLSTIVTGAINKLSKNGDNKPSK